VLGDQVHGAIFKRELDLDFGVALQKVRQRRNELVQAESIAGVDAEVATGSAAQFPHFRLDLITIGEDRSRAGEMDLAFRGQPQPPRCALKKP
jgi:hypothetical protein